jgi:streptogramin lyase
MTNLRAALLSFVLGIIYLTLSFSLAACGGGGGGGSSDSPAPAPATSQTITVDDPASYALSNDYSTGTLPSGIAFDAQGNAWVCSSSKPGTVTKISSGIPQTYSIGGMLSGIAIDHSGNLWATNSLNGNVYKINSAGIKIGTYNVGSNPLGVAVDHDNNIWTVNQGTHNVTKLSQTGAVLGTYNVGNYPSVIKVDNVGDIWVVNSDDDSITKLSTGGVVLGTYYIGWSDPSGLAFDNDNNAWLTCYVGKNSTVVKLDENGNLLSNYSVNYAEGIDTDTHGNVWVTGRDIPDNTNIIYQLKASDGSVQNTWNLNGDTDNTFLVAVDHSGNVWFTNPTQDDKVKELILQ